MDNAKALLILLVVIGHFIGVNSANSIWFSRLYTIIYMFHMPLFVFISGYFAKNVYQNGCFSYRRIFSLIFTYLFFQLIYVLTYAAFGNFSYGLLQILSATDAQWYLLAMILWYLLVPFFSKLAPVPALAATVLLALLSGYANSTDFLALTRVVNMLPYFLAGYYLSLYGSRLVDLANKKTFRILCVVGALGVAIGIACYTHRIGDIPYLYRNISYQSGTHILIRAANGVCAVVLGLGFFAACPRRKTFFTFVGARTLQIYVYHIIIFYITVFSGLYQVMFTQWPGYVRCLIVPLLLTFVLSWKPFGFPFRQISKLDGSRFLK